jgi:tRNA nucleotidyltransferase (CCA-adding enzyme)
VVHHQASIPSAFHRLRQYKMDSKSISLTETETALRKLLLDVVEFIEKSPDESVTKQPLQLRFSGGWVRDKLLGKESDDIDVAINKMTGYDFAIKLKDYLDTADNISKYQFGDHPPPKLHKIDANPDKSKHLETTTTRIFDLDLDFVNLRKETYTDDSRNPQVEFGTPEEDALRRDATINAMFYNIHEQKVEDFTGRGLDDLHAGIIRTPLEPRQTFLDDPLRVLRLLRFASRFGYQIDQQAKDAMIQDDIKRALMLKISRERVLAELEKMLKGPDPRGSLELIDTIRLYTCVFADPNDPDFYHPSLNTWKNVYNSLGKMIHSSSDLQKLVLSSKDDQYQAWVIAAFIPLADAPKVQVKKRKENYIVKVAQEGLKLPTKVVILLNQSREHMEQVKSTVVSKDSTRDSLGMLIRSWGSTWKLQLLFSLLHEIFIDPDSAQGKSTLLHFRHNADDGLAITTRYEAFLIKCQDLEILDAYDFKPLLDGKTLAKALGTSPGPWMKEALDVVMAWQLRNPDITDTSEVVAQVQTWKAQYDNSSQTGQKHAPGLRSNGSASKKQKQGELTSDLISHFLHLTIRPLFSQAKNPELTSTGRRNINAVIDRKGHSISIEEDQLPPWKSPQQSSVLQLLAWSCEKLDRHTVEKEWGVLIPPVLTVLDSSDVLTKAEGCKLLRYVLEQTPSTLLHRTGLIPVFQESLYTSVTYLPTFTDPKDSVIILREAIPALLALTNASCPNSSPERTKSLLEVLRKGILAPLNHASEHVIIVDELQKQLPAVLEALELDSVVHLKDLVPIISTIIDEPFALAYPPLLTSTLFTLQTLLIQARPRIWFWRLDILKGLCGLWLRLHPLAEEGNHSDTSKLDELKEDCVDVMKELDDAVNDKKWTEETIRTEWATELETLQKTDIRLETLFSDL